MIFVDHEEVIEISADLLCRIHGSVDIKLGTVRERREDGRKHACLNFRSDAQLGLGSLHLRARFQKGMGADVGSQIHHRDRYGKTEGKIVAVYSQKEDFQHIDGRRHDTEHDHAVCDTHSRRIRAAVLDCVDYSADQRCQKVQYHQRRTQRVEKDLLVQHAGIIHAHDPMRPRRCRTNQQIDPERNEIKQHGQKPRFRQTVKAVQYVAVQCNRKRKKCHQITAGSDIGQRLQLRKIPVAEGPEKLKTAHNDAKQQHQRDAVPELLFVQHKIVHEKRTEQCHRYKEQ